MGGYDRKQGFDRVIHNIENAPFRTKFDGDKIVTNGGRVLGVVAKGENLKAARANAYKATEWIDFANKYKRNDIGKAIDEA